MVNFEKFRTSRELDLKGWVISEERVKQTCLRNLSSYGEF